MHPSTIVTSAALLLFVLRKPTMAAPVGLFGPLSPQDPGSDRAVDSPPSFGNSAKGDRRSCPNGGNWARFEDDFTGPNAEWVVETGKQGIKYGKNGMTMTLDSSMASTGGIVVASQSRWRAPLKLSVDMRTSGDGGIVNAFILKGEGKTGDEIDLEIAGETFQLPVWKSGRRLTKSGTEGKDLKQSLRHETTEQPGSEYYYRFPGYNPRAWQTYELDWEDDLILWTIDHNERVQFSRKSDDFPLGPLPLRFGPWSTDADQDWAGKLDWNKNPRPQLQLRRLTVEGCRDE